MVIHKCEYCGKERQYKYPSLVRKYCSLSCAKAALRGTKPGKRIKLKCPVCGKAFEELESKIKYREIHQHIFNHYCSVKCAKLAQRKRIVKHCEMCGKSFEVQRNSKQRFCSVNCVNKYKKKSGKYKKNGYWYENGYKVLYVEGNKCIKEHIKVMEEHMGRKLKKNEVVHHINGNKSDNRLQNLKLMTREEHSSYHRKLELKNGKKLFKRVG
ncbi:HNH endonuclease signature motif containing protein [Clostridium luticellarii]|uniref:TRASH domain-containing protein n=1 Tax=Clostridium luticellarii TaxID=1691940 RepID=A0A2T0BQ34_9CLOT|nr:HNH endonuclease signature motif containing protein [Clostridium luticellarii]PRR85991.1 hypothetical protein CLLU_10190 [Clostridium luticellarii]